MTVEISNEKCGHIANCPVDGLCIQICEQKALVEKDNDVEIVNENCNDCGLCISNCPNQAITQV
ncbi:MAG: 4Fe-4S binding protein [Methanobrevibacter sp.]|jgi:Fe-S-cluster-containing hydrogenase component 2|nr:4Fe-4S binding protein [Methanobrevibacter sp.]